MPTPEVYRGSLQYHAIRKFGLRGVFQLQRKIGHSIYLYNQKICPKLVGKADHVKYVGMFLETSYFDKFNNVDINDLAGYKERTRVLYMIWRSFPCFASSIQASLPNECS